MQTEGKGDAQGNLAADWVRFDEQDLRSAQGLEQTAELAEDNAERLAASEANAKKLQQQGFSYPYDKRLYDRLRESHARPVREHFLADPEYQNKSARFLENHDEPRAATTFSLEFHKAAAVITFLSPGLRLFHDGRFEGRRKRISPHLVRAPVEPVDQALSDFYARLLVIMREKVVREGQMAIARMRSGVGGQLDV